MITVGAARLMTALAAGPSILAAHMLPQGESLPKTTTAALTTLFIALSPVIASFASSWLIGIDRRPKLQLGRQLSRPT